MRRMTVWKSCHGVCNLEACFLGAISMVGENYASCPPKLVEIHLQKNEAAQRSLACPSP